MALAELQKNKNDTCEELGAMQLFLEKQLFLNKNAHFYMRRRSRYMAIIPHRR